MKIQKLLFPDKNICSEKDMYYHIKHKCHWGFGETETRIVLPKGAILSADTYFNSFSYAKWEKYTGIRCYQLLLKLRGSALIRIIGKTITKNYQLKDREIFSQEYRDVKGEIEIPFTGISEDTIISFEITAMENVSFLGGYYATEKKRTVLPCRVAIDICTFKRESYVERNMQMLNDYLIENKESSLFHDLYIYIQDNGQTLDKGKLESDYVKVTPNRNTGGVGGFTRGMLNILHDKEQRKLTHILLMDDDAVINPHAIEKMMVFLQLLLPKYKDITVGGALFLLDTPHIQYECGASWNKGVLIPNYHVMDMRNPYMVVCTEREDVKNEYMGWWYCCMPLRLISEDNLPLPVFIHRDDVEYCLRVCKPGFVTMNGISVWHEAFDDKITGVNQYYDMRNDLITNAIHYPTKSRHWAMRCLSALMTRNMMKLRYRYARMNLRAMEDFLKGIDWLKEQDGVALHQEICAMDYKVFPVTKFGVTQEECDRCATDRDWKHRGARESTRFERIAYQIYCRAVSLWKRIRLGFTFNGLLLPPKKGLQIVEPSPGIHRTYRVKRALHYTLNGMGFVTERDIRKVVRCYCEFLRVRRLFLKNFDRVCMEYHDRYHEITNAEFWVGYLKEK
ncbi:glycosyltransferase family 2 protein [bacterium C-53]|nr:glycosyltransferase family 2 protein [Lachnospiraceae bacterium]NBI02639.1 glycosyltransferase family 2 protein [Lachnospiraceae bacterium]RKJ11278.1 glycosyltransferase family 2 protein [bacterium C-53]